MTPVRVAQLTADIRPYRVGFLERLAARPDVEMVVYAGRPHPGQGAPSQRPRVPVPVIEVINRFYPHDKIKVAWHSGAWRMLTSDADVLVCQEIVSNFSVWMIRLLHRLFGKRLVLIGFFYRPAGRGVLAGARDLLRRRLRSSASALIAYTERGRETLLSEGVPADAVFVTSNTLDTERLMEIAATVGNDATSSLRKSLAIPEEALVVAFVGRLRPIKRVEVAIEAVRLAERRLETPVVLVVVGDGESRSQLESEAAGAPVRFLGQTYDDRELAEVFATSSLLVLPGSVGLTCVLGFANGVPCLTTSAEATTQTPEYDYVRSGDNGVIVPSPDPQAYADLIVSLLTDEERLGRLREGAIVSARGLAMEPMVDAFVAAVRRDV